jgi:hypothetical protein
MYVDKRELAKGLFETMGDVARMEENYTQAAYYYLQAAKEAKDPERLVKLSRHCAKCAFIESGQADDYL